MSAVSGCLATPYFGRRAESFTVVRLRAACRRTRAAAVLTGPCTGAHSALYGLGALPLQRPQAPACEGLGSGMRWIMKRRRALVAAAVLTLLTSLAFAAPPANATVGLHVSGRNIVEANGGNFIMRGAAHPHVWFPTQTSSFAAIKAQGANVVRVVLSGGRWTPANGV